MTILQSLAGRYERLAQAGETSVPGFAPAQISFTIVLNRDGSYVTTQDERIGEGKKLRPRSIQAPAAPERTVGIDSGAFWDKTSYVLGCTSEDKTATDAKRVKNAARLAKEHAAFLARHEILLSGTKDPGCKALLAFLRSWSPEHYEGLMQAELMLDRNIAFRLDGERNFVHDSAAARAALIAEAAARDTEAPSMCLITGKLSPVARLHTAIKGVAGTQPGGAKLVSFQCDSFKSYGRVQGANAPVSEAAAFAYATALNGLLSASGNTEKGRPIYRNRIMLGETTVAFWAEHLGNEAFARAVLSDDQEGSFDGTLATDEVTETNTLRTMMRRMQDGEPIRDPQPGLHPESRVYILGLSPNVARLSVRFWVEQSFADFAQHFQQHWADLSLDPAPHPWPPPLWRLLLELAPQRKTENIPPHLGGEVMRSILTGAPYPRVLLTQTIMRIRSDRDEEDRRTGRTIEKVSDLRVAILKACLTRMRRWNLIAEDVPKMLDLATTNSAYRLGRLFAVLERLQRAALGQRNATVRDRFYASASATPALVFPSLIRNARNHSKAVRTKVGTGLAEWFEDHIAEIVSGMAGSFPRTLPIEEQGRFALGYYHQRDVFRRKKDVPAEIEQADNIDDAEGD